MDLYDFFTTVVRGVAQDNALRAWAMSNFGKNITVLNAMPSENFPDMTTDTPFVLFSEPARRCSQSRRTIDYSFGAWFGLSDSGDEVIVIDNEEKPTGIQLVLDGMRLVRLAVVSSLPEGIDLDDFEEHSDVNAVGDEVHGDMEFYFSEKLTIGQNPME